MCFCKNLTINEINVCVARASLYPSISSLKPSLLFERGDSLLIAWGDCLMNTSIQSSNGAKGDRRVVKCVMAWQLDCIACGVVPMDSEHVAVLGLVANAESDIELQVISRANGAVVQSDLIPLVHPESEVRKDICTSQFTFCSSFSTPRMEDIFEAEEEEHTNDEVIDFDIQSMLNAELASSFGNASSSKKFTVPHMKWNIKSYKELICSEFSDDEESSLDSNSSEYSDDYTFLFHPNKSPVGSKPLLWQAPTMIITSFHDAVLVQTRDVDDSIKHAKLCGNHGIALRRGLDHRQIIRRHNLNELIDEYFSAVLFQSDPENSSLLTIRRLKIAARATEILFGGNIQMWDKWIQSFAKIPGALFFLLRPHIPTRGEYS